MPILVEAPLEAGVLDAQVRVSVAQTATNIDIKNITAIRSPIQGSGP